MLCDTEATKVLQASQAAPLKDKFVGRTKHFGHCTNAPFDKARKRQNVGCTIAELGEKAHHRVGGMIGTYDKAPNCAGNSVLGDHALARLDVTENQIFVRVVTKAHPRAWWRLKKMASVADFIFIVNVRSGSSVAIAICASLSSIWVP